MRPLTLVIRGLRFHWRSHVAVALGVATATATLTGALLVGDSLRASLRDSALNRLGSVEQALVSQRFFRQALAEEIAADPAFDERFGEICSAILLRGGATHAHTHARVNGINVVGVDRSFWNLQRSDRSIPVDMPAGRAVVLNEPLARELGAQVGADVVIRIGRPSAIPTETLLGRRDDTSATIRLTVASVVPAEGLGAFSLRPSQLPPRNAWISMDLLQRVIDRRDRVNAILVGGMKLDRGQAEDDADWLRTRMRASFDLADLGLRIRIDSMRYYLSLESERLLISPPVERAALAAARYAGARADPLLTYLANRIEIDRKTAEGADAVDQRPNGAALIPYSTVTALPNGVFAFAKGVSLGPGKILLNRWAADDLKAVPGDTIRLTYYMTGALGKLESVQATFLLSGVVGMNQATGDPGFTPEYKGITDVRNLADWDPPFPIDLKLIRQKDEAYWDRYRAAPKAFLSLEDGRRLWADQPARFGASTAIRMRGPKGSDLTTLARNVERELRARLDPARLGLEFEPVRQRINAASRGTTDFGMLFIGFSFFLIAAAALLAALFFRLGVEQRTREVGIELATGFSSRQVTKYLLAEGGLIVIVGGGVGLLAAGAYTWLMLAGLRTWWSAATNAPFLRVYIRRSTLGIGFGISAFLAILTIAWSIRGFARQPARVLLAGETQARKPPKPHASAFAALRKPPEPHASVCAVPQTPQAPSGFQAPRGLKSAARRGRRSIIVAAVSSIAALALMLLPTFSDSASRAGAFFGSGAAFLVVCLAMFSHFLQARGGSALGGPSRSALVRLGMRNAARNPGRSLLTAGLIASATFVVTALAAFRLDAKPDASRTSGTGGFALVAEASVDLPFDLNTPEGQEALGITENVRSTLTDLHAVPFRLRPGDETGCVNLYTPTRPRILGATDAMIQRGGFAFQSTLAETPAEQENPWLLLNRELSDGAIPVIGDEAAVLWQLHLGLGKELQIEDERGNPVRLRFVALLAGSVLQDELIIAESRFVELFPSLDGYGFFLLEAPPGAAAEIGTTLENELAAYSFDVTAADRRLAGFLAVQNTYLSTFQMLGGLGLVLGTVGLAVVLLRNVWERRGELALMRALGFSRMALATTVLAENVALVVVGLLAGFVPALLAVAPHLVSRPTALPWSTIGVTLVGVLVVGVGGGAVALIPTLKAPLLPALRRE